tara:strand:+ start:809 stop:1105 length:297 start_codon:yes stop_codon:yes gene_type:complete
MITNTTSHYDSSTLTSAEYNYKTKALIVNFNHASYLYEDVSHSDFESFNNAESQGKALNEFIKGKYEYDKLVDENIDIKYPKGSLLNELPPEDYQLDN